MGNMWGGGGAFFTRSQWMELEHQALIYEYINADVPIPSYLLNPIRKAFQSTLRSNPLRWGFSNSDPEPGRCRRTDGKKWRCSRDAVANQKYCERHMNRGRHRSRKHVEGGANQLNNLQPSSSTLNRSGILVDKEGKSHSLIQEFGLVCSDSLLNPLLDRSSENHLDSTQLSISISVGNSDFTPPTNKKTKRTSSSQELEMGLGVGNWDHTSWEPSIAGPLGEVVLQNTSNTIVGDTINTKHLNTIDKSDNSSSHCHLVAASSSPNEVLQRGAFMSLSNSSSGEAARELKAQRPLKGLAGSMEFFLNPTSLP